MIIFVDTSALIPRPITAAITPAQLLFGAYDETKPTHQAFEIARRLAVARGKQAQYLPEEPVENTGTPTQRDCG